MRRGLDLLPVHGERHDGAVHDLVDVGLLVAFQAVPIGESERHGFLPHPVRHVTVCAGGDGPWLFLPQLAADPLHVHLLDAAVALHAGRSDVAGGDGSPGVRVRQDQMGAVTVGARRRHDEPLLEQTDAVDALGVVLDDVVLPDVVVAGHRRAFPVAASAQVGHVHLVGDRLGVLGRADVVGAVAFAAGGGEGGFPVQGLTVDAGVEVHLRVVVAGAAAHRLQILGVRQVLRIDVLVAVVALQAAVHRLAEDPGVHEERDDLAAPLRLQVAIAVALEADRRWAGLGGGDAA